MNLENIHVIRKSYQTLQGIVQGRYNDPNWNSLVEGTGWFTHVRMLLASAARVIEVMEGQGACVLVHCSDGWDRTAQICAVAQIMISPYYRTIEGFELLIEKDWLAFGHKFGQRHGQLEAGGDDSQRAPIFLLFLDAVWQLIVQFPCSFEFNELFLVAVAEASYSSLYGTFLLNNEWERKEAEVRRRTVSVWSVLNQQKVKFSNVFYVPDTHTLRPSITPDRVGLWRGYFLRFCPEVWAGMTRELRAMQLQSIVEGKDCMLHDVIRENEKLKKQISELVDGCKKGWSKGSPFDVIDEQQRTIEDLKKRIAELERGQK